MEFQNSDQYYGKVQKPQQPQQQVEQKQQDEQAGYKTQLYNKWYNIFANGNDQTFSAMFGGAGKRGIIGAADNIKVPEDETERQIAVQAARDFCTYYKSLNLHSINPKNPLDPALAKSAPRLTKNYNIARAFINNCVIYEKKLNKTQRKETNQLYKEGVAGYGQMDVQPKSTNAKDIFEAAERAGKQAALYFKNQDKEGLESCFGVIKPNLSNKEYNVIFYYTYLNNIKYHNISKEQDRIARINSLKVQYDNYKQKANNNQFETGALDRIRGYNQNTTQQVYNAK